MKKVNCHEEIAEANLEIGKILQKKDLQYQKFEILEAKLLDVKAIN